MDSIDWIKLATSIFDNNKIKYIRTLPDGNNIVLFWIMLLVKAGQCNANGYVLVTENIAYSEELLAEEFKFSVTLVKAALKLFEQLQMISFDNSVICIENWAKYQNVEGLEKIKENNRIRQARYRAKKKLMLQSNVTDNVNNNTDVTSNVTQSNAVEEEEEKEIEIDIDKDKKPPKRFTAPSLEDVKEYCSERKNNVDAERFIDYYTANGWKVGKNPMKDWKAAVRSWERNVFGKPKAAETEHSFDLDDFFNSAVDKTRRQV